MSKIMCPELWAMCITSCLTGGVLISMQDWSLTTQTAVSAAWGTFNFWFFAYCDRRAGWR